MTEGVVPAAPPTRRMLVGLLVSALLVGVVAWRVDFGSVKGHLAGIALGPFAAAMGLKLGAILVKATRWSVVLAASLGHRPRRAVSACFLGYFGNAVFPMRLGDVVRVDVVRRHNGVPFSQVLATLVVERALDGSVVLALVLLGSLLAGLPLWARGGAIAFAAILAALVASMLFLARGGSPLSYLPERMRGAIAERLQGVLERFRLGFRVLRSLGRLGICFLLACLVWTLELGGTALALSAADISVGWAPVLLLTSLVALGLSAPSGPAGVGTHQALYAVVLGTFGVEAERAVALSLAIMTTGVAMHSAIGLPLAVREGLSLSAFTRGREAT